MLGLECACTVSQARSHAFCLPHEKNSSWIDYLSLEDLWFQEKHEADKLGDIHCCMFVA